MDQGFTDGARPDDNRPSGSPTELQRRVAEGVAPRTILEELWQTMLRLYGYGCKRLGDTSQADDFVQKVFLKMQVNFARMIAREPVEAWIFTVARNEIVDWYRSGPRAMCPRKPESCASATRPRNRGAFRSRSRSKRGSGISGPCMPTSAPFSRGAGCAMTTCAPTGRESSRRYPSGPWPSGSG